MNSKLLDKIKLFVRSSIVFIVFFCSFIFQIIPIYLFRIDTASMSGISKISLYLSTFSSCCTAIVLLLIYRKDLVREWKVFRKDILKNLDIGLVCWVTGLIIMVVANSLLMYFFHSKGANNEKAVQSLISISPLIMSFSVCILAPFNEELVFRKAIKDVFNNVYLFMFMSFIIFGGAHVIGSAKSIVDYLYIIPYGALGGAFAYAYSKTNTIYTTLLFHMFHNTVLFIIAVFI